MGGTTSKVANPLDFKVDMTTAQFSAAELERQLAQKSLIAQRAVENAASTTWAYAKIWIWLLVIVIILGGIGAAIYFAFFSPKPQVTLDIQSVTFDGKDYTDGVKQKVSGDSLYLGKGLSEINGVDQKNLTDANVILYKFSDEAAPTQATIGGINEIIDISKANRESFSNKRVLVSQSNKSGPTMWSKLSSFFSSDNSGNQLPYPKDASSQSIVPSASAQDKGVYGMQFWMYIKDWNYNFGKEKHVLSRSDSTNSAIMNPNITLHPTDNTMKVSISVFPSSESSSTKLVPAPAGHSGSTDDVYVCEIPDIPLQTWVSVSLTVFERNLDVYLNGKLVKSCVLSGVPKLASGDIQLNNAGGFSGYLCGFYHYSRMLVPSDAQLFFSAGTSCSSATDSSPLAKTTGYGFKFGIYDANGKTVNQYTF